MRLRLVAIFLLFAVGLHESTACEATGPVTSTYTASTAAIETSNYGNNVCNRYLIAPFLGGTGTITLTFEWREFYNSNDKVKVYLNSATSPVATLSGETTADWQNVYASVSSISIVFETDGSGNCCDTSSWGGCDDTCDGFRLVYTTEPVCPPTITPTSTYTALTGTIETVNYGHNVCNRYLIAPFPGAPAGSITLTFDWREFYNSGDKVKVYLDSSTIPYLTLSGDTFSDYTVTVEGVSSVSIVLETDSSGNCCDTSSWGGCDDTCDGFRLVYQADAFCSLTSDWQNAGTYTTFDGVIQTSNYGHNLCSRYLISPFEGGETGTITLSFDWREFYNSFDKVKIFLDSASSPVEILTGDTSVDWVASYSGVSTISVVLETNGNGNCCDSSSWGGCSDTCDGFRLEYSSRFDPCSGYSRQTAATGAIQTSNYGNNWCSRWVIDPFEPGEVGDITVNVEWREFYNSYDNIKIYRGGAGEVDILLATLSGETTADWVQTYSGVSALSVVMQTNGNGNCCDSSSWGGCSDTCDGFRMSWSSSQLFNCTTCDGSWAACADSERCECLSGFVGSGVTGDCLDVDECTPQAVNCTDRGGEPVGSKCYYSPSQSPMVNGVVKTFGNAQHVCEALGGQLASILSSEENDAVWTIKRKIGNPYYIWIGYTDTQTEGTWTWVANGVSPGAVTYWDGREPDDESGVQNCAAMKSSDGWWGDLYCGTVLPFVCEIPTTSPFLNPGTNDCATVLPGSYCSNIYGGFSCECPSGYTNNGTVCVDIDECAIDDDDCGALEDCVNTIGGHNCICKTGYSGDPCENIDECLGQVCHQNASCSDNPGSFTCACNSGYRGDGRSCTNINECSAVQPPAPSVNGTLGNGTEPATGPLHDCDPDFGTCADTQGSFVCGCVAGYTTSSDGNPIPETGSPTGNGTECYDADECLYETHACDADAECTNLAPGYSCSCKPGFAGSGWECIQLCSWEESSPCNHLADCGDGVCSCPEGLLGDGYGVEGCTGNAWTVRFSFKLGHPFDINSVLTGGKLPGFEASKADYIALFDGAWLPPGFATSLHHEIADFMGPPDLDVGPMMTVNALFPNQTTAEAARDVLYANILGGERRSSPVVFGLSLDFAAYDVEPRVYRWVAPTTGAEIQIAPTGFSVNAVHFEPVCKESGCWVIDIVMAAGQNTFNTWYLPNAVGDDTISYDFNYDVVMSGNWTLTAQDSFLPANHPCRTHDYVPDDSDPPPPEVTVCCLPEFLDLYRTTKMFQEQFDPEVRTACDAGLSPKLMPDDSHLQYSGEEYYVRPTNSLEGGFDGLRLADMVFTGVVDPHIRQYTFKLYLDEVETRRLAGILRGTVGVEHTVDTFIGLANFKPTGIAFLDPFATQVNLHFEKTSFFSVSTHGTNDYTFLEYVNMRLVAIYNEDADFSGASEAGSRTLRTDPSGNACYLQVTFTMGAQYVPNLDSGGLIPLDSVRAGRGTFFDDTPLEHLCSMYDDGDADDNIGLAGLTDDIAVFDSMLAQACAPQSAMCLSPAATPDSFVAFNIPLGFEVFDGQADASLSSNIFVSMVINAINEAARGGSPLPNDGGEPWQMKTTLTASIPIVAGGVNIFCDGVTAKTDLKDVANADVIVGSAVDREELTRLRIVSDIASTDLDAVPSTQIDTASIEAGLMTLVLKGNTSYFKTGASNTGRYSLELDDLITIHLMTDGEAPSESDAECATATEPKSVDCQVRDLLAELPDDNSDSKGLDTDGYALNGAFRFEVMRGAGIAKLQPSGALLGICPFNPRRPAGGVLLESCVTRRDVQSRAFPWRTGAEGPTAIEVLAQSGPLASDDVAAEIALLGEQATGGARDECGCSGESGCCEAAFMQLILGASDYARDLAVNYAKAIHERYDLNGRYIRAFWINPGYEWTPTQAGGRSIFSVSQKIYLIALITLDENIARRRVLLSTSVDPTKQSGSGVGASQLSFAVDRKSMMASAFAVPADKVALFEVEMQLTAEEACLEDVLLVESLRATLLDYLRDAASAFHTVQVLAFSRDLNGEQCARRRLPRRLLSSFSAATVSVQMMVVFVEEGSPVFNDAAFAAMPGVSHVAADPSNANIKSDTNYINPNPGGLPTDEDQSSGSSNVVLIGGIAGAVGALLVAVGAVLYMRKHNLNANSATAATVPVGGLGVADLKFQLQGIE